MIKIFWPTVWLATIILAISYFRMRDGISTKKRDKFEKWIMFAVIILLIINIGLLINERKLTANEMNVCIEFYRYFPDYRGDENYHIIDDWCLNYFNELEIEKLKRSGRGYLNKNTQMIFKELE